LRQSFYHVKLSEGFLFRLKADYGRWVVILNKATARRGSQAGGFVFTTSWVEGEIFVKNVSFQNT